MIDFSNFWPAAKEVATGIVVEVGKYVSATIVTILIIELLRIGCQWYIARNFDVNKDLKKYDFFIRISMILLAAPVIIFVVLPMFGISNSLFDDSDILGYYGAVIGGGVTVLGVYWTLNYESKKSKEERKESSLPIFTFSIHSNTENSSNDCNDIGPFLIGENLKYKFKDEDDKLTKRCLEITKKISRFNYTIADLDEDDSITSQAIDSNPNGEKKEVSIDFQINNIAGRVYHLNKEIEEIINERKICRLDKSFILNINNIGLQPAILSTIRFIPKGIISSSDERKERTLNYLSVQKGKATKLKVIFDWYFENQDGMNAEFRDSGYLELKYTDLYFNRYEYNIPIKIKKEIVQEKDKIPIEQFSVIIDTPQLPIRPKPIKG